MLQLPGMLMRVALVSLESAEPEATNVAPPPVLFDKRPRHYCCVVYLAAVVTSCGGVCVCVGGGVFLPCSQVRPCDVSKRAGGRNLPRSTCC